MPVMRNTVQREIIHETLCRMKNHPTALMVYEEVHREHPAISRSTVYRVLGRLAEENQILRLHLAGSDNRYDGNTSRHYHITCRCCGAVGDISPVVVGEPVESDGFLVEDWTIVYTGLCPKCRRKQKKDIPPKSEVSYKELSE